ncbi:hypothetical protein [Mycolicibacterium mucogenicum]|nr:hypothetical protein [Mycolicibacterium mucogenicum]
MGWLVGGWGAVVIVAAASIPLTACSQFDDSSHNPATPRDVNFPDLSTFTAAESGSYSKLSDAKSVFGFLTPLGLRCSLATGRESQPDGVSCVGPIPGRSHQWSLRVERGSGAKIYIELNKSGPGIFTPPATPSPTLARHEALQINQGDIACGILDVGTPACHIGDHGFVVNLDNVVLF